MLRVIWVTRIVAAAQHAGISQLAAGAQHLPTCSGGAAAAFTAGATTADPSIEATRAAGGPIHRGY